MRLTKRDKLIIDLLRAQDFCFYSDIRKRFFSSYTSASHRLNSLKKNGYIEISPFSSLSLKSNIDKASLEVLEKGSKIISLVDKLKLLRRRPSHWKKTHQLLMFSVKERLEDILGQKALFEAHLRNLKKTIYDRTFEPLPDFYFKADDFKLAVELELNKKSRNRYSLKMSGYKESSYTHILYVVLNSKKINNFVELFKYRKFVGISHYAKPDEVISYRYGNISLLEWLNKKSN